MKIARKISRRSKYLLVVLAVTTVFSVKKALYLSAGPVGEKECPPIDPTLADDSSKQTTIQIEDRYSVLPWSQKGGTINDASCLSKTAVFGIVDVRTVGDVRQALEFARAKKLKVSIAGVRHSMGGHAFAKNAVVLDMRKFNAIVVNAEKKTVTVEAGATWHDIQEKLHPKFAVKAMQSTDIFTVGGSISVNAHGMDHQVGALAKSIRSMRIMKADGTIKTISRTQDPELFNYVVGGYGLFGVILDAELEIADNAVYESERMVLDYKAFPGFFASEIEPNKKVGLMYAHLSTGPQSFLKEMILYAYKDVGSENAVIPPLGEVSGIRFRRFIFNLAKQGSIPMRLKWWAEKTLEPMLESCTVSRNQALTEGEACLVSRNEPMHDSVPYLRNNLKNDTDILHEYFIPRGALVPFVDELREALTRNEARVLNASVRVVHKEDNFLSYAPQDSFSVVLYLNQKTDEAGNERMRTLTQELVQLTLKHGGRFFLPYQTHFTNAQLHSAYPQIEKFFDAKQKHDPAGLFSSTFYEKYTNQL